MIAQMAQRLNAIIMGMGFSGAIKPEVLLNYSRWIKEQFGDLSMQEVSLAFDLVTAKKIGTDIRHYNTFSQQYLGDVLHAYKTYRSHQIKLHSEAEKVKQIQAPKDQITGEQMYKLMYKLATEKGEIMKVGDWTGAYNYAWKNNLVKRLSEQERTEYKESLIKAMASEKRAGIENALTPDIQTECHKRLLQAHLTDCKTKGIDLTKKI